MDSEARKQSNCNAKTLPFGVICDGFWPATDEAKSVVPLKVENRALAASPQTSLPSSKLAQCELGPRVNGFTFLVATGNASEEPLITDADEPALARGLDHWHARASRFLAI
ncbi:hypothetical protein IVB33_33025 [Bradyrhizobium sp. 24]|nr:hypothetical protein [Bradyrhizobium sp. 24]